MTIDPTIREAVLKTISSNKAELIEFLKGLVRIPSVVGEEGTAQKFIGTKFTEMTLQVDTWEPDITELRDHPAFFETTSYITHGYKGRPNVSGRLEGAGKGNSLLLSGHIDVVSPEPVARWKHDPWGAEIEQGRLYGRGAADMKGGIAAMIYAVHAIQQVGVQLQGDVTLQTTIEEEDGGIGGVLHSIIRGYTANAAIVPEPRSGTEIGIGAAGVLYFRIKIPGKTMHAVYAHKGVNAIGKAMRIYDALMALNKTRQHTIRAPLFEREEGMEGHATTINVGTIRGGDWPSTVAGFVELGCRIAWPPGEEITEIKAQVEETIEQVNQSDLWLKENPATVEWFGWQTIPHLQDPHHPIVQLVKNHFEEISGSQATICGVPWGLDTRFYVLYANIPALTCGPRGGNLHGIDEYVELDTVVETTKILALTILDWCSQDKYYR
ncbi:MAG: ArgE/DapE family deacylase [Candidatus Heimdallarchaeota archaeon]